MQLNRQQQAAVDTTAKRVFVIAGAGAGKTSTLTERITKLIQQDNVSPHDILAFTFTRKAADEMRVRLEKKIGECAKKVRLSTMHGIGLQLLKQYGDCIGLRADKLTIYSEWESEMLLRDVCTELGVLKDGRWIVKKKVIMSAFANFEQNGVEPTELDDTYPVFKSFHQRCKENNALSFSGLIHGLRLLLEDGRIVENEHWKHVLVDEVQDIDLLQWKIIESLAEHFGAHLFCVGDVNQSIYGFRGAVPEYLLEHKDSFEILPIEMNYRSAASLVVAANNLIRHNKERMDNVMIPAVLDNNVSHICTLNNADSATLGAAIKHILDSGNDFPESLAVLARSHGLLEGIGNALQELGIPFRRIGEKTSLTRSEGFRTIIAPVKLAVNPYDNFSYMLFRRVLGVSDEDYQELRSTALNETISHYQAHIKKFGAITDSDSLETLISWSIRQVSDATDLPQLDRISFFLGEWMGRWAKSHCTQPTERDFLEWLALYDVQEELDEDEDQPQVTLMTIHASKGLEFPTVILYGCNESILPHKKSMSVSGLEEERRLAYVACTRAKERLILAIRPEVEEKEVHGHLVKKTQLTSRFVSELQN